MKFASKAELYGTVVTNRTARFTTNLGRVRSLRLTDNRKATVHAVRWRLTLEFVSFFLVFSSSFFLFLSDSLFFFTAR